MYNWTGPQVASAGLGRPLLFNFNYKFFILYIKSSKIKKKVRIKRRERKTEREIYTCIQGLRQGWLEWEIMKNC